MGIDELKDLHEAIQEFTTNLDMIGWKQLGELPEGKELERIYDTLVDLGNNLEDDIEELEED